MRPSSATPKMFSQSTRVELKLSFIHQLFSITFLTKVNWDYRILVDAIRVINLVLYILSSRFGKST